MVDFLLGFGVDINVVGSYFKGGSVLYVVVEFGFV